ncbi:unnamed protein product [Cyprideis torosa]|uniref:Uncharacterized protein n=1 Tax=Cyprideis torosa TaxID=163714 RepID=A0A7R8W704_9CRUS|nr:unnamed protein product [Cyprideis torosa]CAG0882259.1 unnamed protein product [Cyprideis torosa]
MFTLALVSLCICLSSATYLDDYHHPKDVVVEEKTIGRAYSDVKVKQENDGYYYHVLGKSEQDQGLGKEYADHYRHVSAKIIPKKAYIVVDKYGHKKEIVDYEVPFKAQWGGELKLPIVSRTKIVKKPVLKVVKEIVPVKEIIPVQEIIPVKHEFLGYPYGDPHVAPHYLL